MGRRGRRLRRGLDLRLLAADPRDRLRDAAGREVHATRRASARSSPPTSCSTSAGDARAREPGDGGDRARRAGRERLLPARHLAPRLLLRRRAAPRARVLRPAARDGNLGRLRADSSRISRRAPTPTTPSSGRSFRPRDDRGADRSRCCAARTRCCGSTPAFSSGSSSSTEHLTVGTITVPVGAESAVESHCGRGAPLRAARRAARVSGRRRGDARARRRVLAPGGRSAQLRGGGRCGRGGDLRRRAVVRDERVRLKPHPPRATPAPCRRGEASASPAPESAEQALAPPPSRLRRPPLLPARQLAIPPRRRHALRVRMPPPRCVPLRQQQHVLRRRRQELSAERAAVRLCVQVLRGTERPPARGLRLQRVVRVSPFHAHPAIRVKPDCRAAAIRSGGVG